MTFVYRKTKRYAVAALAVLLACPAVAQTAGDVHETLPPPTGLAPYFTAAGDDAIAPDADGFLHRWLLLEPVVKPNGSNTAFTASYVRAALAPSQYPGRFNTLPRNGEITAGNLRWRALDAVMFDIKLFNMAQGLGKPTYGVIFWVATVVNVQRPMTVRLAVGSNSASLWWLDGREATGLFGDRRMVQDDAVSRPLMLHKGRNILRGAVINGPGLSDFCVRFLDAAAQPVRDLTISTH